MSQTDRITQHYWRGSEREKGKIVYLTPRTKSNEEAEMQRLERLMDIVALGTVFLMVSIVVVAQVGMWQGWW